MLTAFTISMLTHPHADEPCVTVTNPFGTEVAAAALENDSWNWIMPGAFSSKVLEAIFSPAASTCVSAARLAGMGSKVSILLEV